MQARLGLPLRIAYIESLQRKVNRLYRYGYLAQPDHRCDARVLGLRRHRRSRQTPLVPSIRPNFFRHPARIGRDTLILMRLSYELHAKWHTSDG